MSGMVVGGWEYVWGAYGLTVVVLVGYALSMVLRSRGDAKAGGR